MPLLSLLPKSFEYAYMLQRKPTVCSKPSNKNRYLNKLRALVADRRRWRKNTIISIIHILLFTYNRHFTLWGSFLTCLNVSALRAGSELQSGVHIIPHPKLGMRGGGRERLEMEIALAPLADLCATTYNKQNENYKLTIANACRGIFLVSVQQNICRAEINKYVKSG